MKRSKIDSLKDFFDWLLLFFIESFRAHFQINCKANLWTQTKHKPPNIYGIFL